MREALVAAVIWFGCAFLIMSATGSETWGLIGATVVLVAAVVAFYAWHIIYFRRGWAAHPPAMLRFMLARIDDAFPPRASRHCYTCNGSGFYTEKRPPLQIGPGNFVNGDKTRRCGCR